MSLDLALIGGKFTENNLPPERQFLIKYFQSPVTKCFLFYFFAFNKLLDVSVENMSRNFVDHTGNYISKQRLRFLVAKTRILIEAIEQAERDLDLPLVDKIKSGKFRPNQSKW